MFLSINWSKFSRIYWYQESFYSKHIFTIYSFTQKVRRHKLLGVHYSSIPEILNKARVIEKSLESYWMEYFWYFCKQILNFFNFLIFFPKLLLWNATKSLFLMYNFRFKINGRLLKSKSFVFSWFKLTFISELFAFRIISFLKFSVKEI